METCTTMRNRKKRPEFLQEIVEPEPQGFGWGSAIALVVGLVVAGSILKFGCKKLKK